MHSAVKGEVGSASVHLAELAAGADRHLSGLTEALLRMMVDAAPRNAESAREACRAAASLRGAVLQVAATSEENSAAAEQVAASTEELTAHAHRLGETAKLMQALARELKGTSERFAWERRRVSVPVPVDRRRRPAA